MGWTRRRWGALGLVAAVAAGVGAWRQPALLRRIRIRLQPIASPERELLTHLVDLLVPADEGSPGAVDLGIHRALLARAAADPPLADLLASGCLWLDREAQSLAGRQWLQLSPEAQQASLQRIADGPPLGFPGRFFWRLRDDTLDAYYANPVSWQTLSYRGPPQPAGYADYTEPPARA